MKIWVCLIGLVGSFFALSALADTGLRVYEEGRRQYFSSKNISNGQAKELGMRQAASDLRKFLDNFPNHPKAPDALFNVGSIFLDLVQLTGDRDAATRSVHYFKELVAKYPKHRLADDALYQIASICKEVFQDQKCVDDAYRRILGE